MAKDKYEISIWQDRHVPAQDDIPAHYEEEKIAVIGSDTMTATCRAYEPVLTENINGSNTFTFKMHYKYKEFGNDEMLDNPFLSLLVTERKIKVYWRDKWYDFIIKNCQESSDGKHCVYTCRDSYISELSKTGFNIEFDTELGNNQGTAKELAEKTLEDTDWIVLNGDVIQQETEEPGYYITTRSSFGVENETDGGALTVPSDAKIFVFYSYIQKVKTDLAEGNTPDSECQLLYDAAQEYPRDINSQLIVDVPCMRVEGLSWSESGGAITASKNGSPIFTVANPGNVSNQYRGSRLVKSQKCVLDPLTDKYSYIYTTTTSRSGLYDVGDTIYEYRTTLWNGPTAVMNVVANAANYTNTEGWYNGTGIRAQLSPSYTEASSASDMVTYNGKNYLRLQNTWPSGPSEMTGGCWYYNVGLTENGNYIPNGIQRGEKYIFRMKAKATSSSGDMPDRETWASNGLWPYITQYTYHSATSSTPAWYEPNTSDFYMRSGQSRATIVVDDDGETWQEWELTCTKSFSREETATNEEGKGIGIFVRVVAEASTGVRWLRDVQFFPLVMGLDENNNPVRINPGQMNTASVANPVSKFYNYTKSFLAGHEGDETKRKYKEASKIPYVYVGKLEDNSELRGDIQEVWNANFEKIRTIKVKNSNRFNILQTIAETFECWCRFEIEHEDNGAVKIIDGVPQKFVRFVKEVGQETGIGFIYGIDLKAITRKIQSDQIVTKTIVTPNNNEFAEDGFCTIARSTENYTRDNFILNFDYYVNQGLLDGETLNLDLYSNANGHLNYYNRLRSLNTQYDDITDWLVPKKRDLLTQQSYFRTYDAKRKALDDEIASLEDKLAKTAAVTIEEMEEPENMWQKIYNYVTENASQREIADIFHSLQNDKAEKVENDKKCDELSTSIEVLKSDIEQAEERQRSIERDLKELNLSFFKKYSRFIQEGFWISEDYMDDNLYFLDAQSVAYTSSRPQVSYDISVIRISSVEGFENKIFRLGDISFIQDTEFFGYTTINGVKTPIKEKVLVSEIVSNFDAPDQDKLKIQNYKTQFEDLFHRIVSTTQQLQYTTGEYARAASGFQTNGTLTYDVLQASFDESAELVMSAQNEAIIQDNTGITVSDSNDPRKKTRITSNGIFITTDGGETWKNAVRGEGIATQYLTAGYINVTDINIFGGTNDGNPTFKWDSYGLDAFAWDEQNGVNLGKFVRHDQYGFYGVDFNEPNHYDRFKPQEMSDVWNTANFGLTWDGFFFKNKGGNYWIEISDKNDFAILEGDPSEPDLGVPRVKIGRLDSVNGIYGLLINDKDGNAVLKASNANDSSEDDSTLWLTGVLNIENSDLTSEQRIRIGYFDSTTKAINETINVNDEFIVWEDGSVKTNVGEIGGIQVDQLATKIETAGTQFYPINNSVAVTSGADTEKRIISIDFITVATGLLFLQASVIVTVQVIDELKPASVGFFYQIGDDKRTDFQPIQTILTDGIYTIPLSYMWSSISGTESQFKIYISTQNCKVSIGEHHLLGALFGRGLATEDAVKRSRHDNVGLLEFGGSMGIFGVKDTHKSDPEDPQSPDVNNVEWELI